MTEAREPDPGGPPIDAIADVIDALTRRAEAAQAFSDPVAAQIQAFIDSPIFKAGQDLADSAAFRQAQELIGSPTFQAAARIAGLVDEHSRSVTVGPVTVRGAVTIPKPTIRATGVVTAPEFDSSSIESELADLPGKIEKQGPGSLTAVQTLMLVVVCLLILGVPVATIFAPTTLQTIIEGEEQVGPWVVTIAIIIWQRNRNR